MHGWSRFVVAALAALVSSRFVAAQTPPTGPVAGVTLTSAGSEPRQQLAYKFQLGHFVNFEVVNKMTMTTQYQQATEKVTHESKTWKQLRVISIDESGNILLEPYIQRVIMSAKFNDAEPTVFDSDKPDETPHQFNEVAKTVKKPVARVLVTSSGELLKITLLEGAPASLAQGGTAADPRLNFLTSMPKEPVGVGGIWKDRFEAPVNVGSNGLQQMVKLQRVYEVTKIEGNIATISLKTGVITPVSDPQIELQLMQRTPTGVLEFDIARGCVLSQRTIGDRTVVGALGPNTQVRSTMETIDRWLPPAGDAQPAKLETTSLRQ